MKMNHVDWKSLLPNGYSYSDFEDYEDLYSFRIKEVIDGASAREWVKRFCFSSHMGWRVMNCYPNGGKYEAFKIIYRCQYKTDRRARGLRPSKNTDCPIKLEVRIERTEDEYPTLIIVKNKHNHALETTYKKPAPENQGFPRKQFVSSRDIMQDHTYNCGDENFAPETSIEEDLCDEEEEAELATDDEMEQLRALFRRMQNCIYDKPSIFVPALKSMLENVKAFARTEKGLASAMQFFGWADDSRSSKQKAANCIVIHANKYVKVNAAVQTMPLSRKNQYSSKKRKHTPGSLQNSFVTNDTEFLEVTEQNMQPCKRVKAEPNTQQ